MNIPDISFNHNKSEQAELEVLPLSRLYLTDFISHNPQLPHRVSFFILICIDQGEGKHMVDFKTVNFSPGSLIFVQPEQVHAFDFSAHPQGHIVLFTQKFLDRVHANMRLPNYTPTHLNQQHTALLMLDTENHSRINTFINEMCHEIKHVASDPLIVMYLFSTLALMLHRLRPQSRHDDLSTGQSIKLSDFFSLLQAHFTTTRDANWYANKLNITYKTLNTLCKLSNGLTAKNMIDAFTLIEMKRRLVIANLSTQKLAYDFGFDDVSNFVKYFKKHVGSTPSQFQKQYKIPVL